MDARVVETHRTHTHAWSLQNHTPSLPGCPPGSIHFVSGVPHRDHIRRGTWPRAFLSLYSTHTSHIYTCTSPPHTTHTHVHSHTHPYTSHPSPPPHVYPYIHPYTHTHTHTHHTPHSPTHHTYTHTHTTHITHTHHTYPTHIPHAHTPHIQMNLPLPHTHTLSSFWPNFTVHRVLPCLSWSLHNTVCSWGSTILFYRWEKWSSEARQFA